MFGKKAVTPIQINLNNPLQLDGYVPSPALHHAFVFVVDKNITDTVNGVGKGLGIRVPITTATLDSSHPMAKIYGSTVILLDGKYAGGLWMPGRKKELLAALAATNAIIFDDHKWSTMDNVATEGVETGSAPERVFQLLDGGVEYGFKAARNAANRQNKMIDKGLKPIVKDLNKQWKKSSNKDATATPPKQKTTPKAEKSVADLIEEPVN